MPIVWKKYIVKYLQLGGKCLTFCNILVKSATAMSWKQKCWKKIKLSKTYPLCILLLWWPKLGTYESVWSNCYPKGFVLWIWNCGWQALIDSPKILGCQKPTAQILTQALPKKPKKIGEILWTIHTGSLILNGNLIILMKLNWAQ